MSKETKISLREDRQIMYNFLVPSLSLVVLFFVVLAILMYSRWRFPAYLGVVDLVIVSLGTFRIIRGITFDKVFRFVREYFKYSKTYAMPDGAPAYVVRTERWGWRRAISETFECAWCTGIWATVLALFLYFFGPLGRLVIFILAIAGAASFVQIIIAFVGAEYEVVEAKVDKGLISRESFR